MIMFANLSEDYNELAELIMRYGNVSFLWLPPRGKIPYAMAMALGHHSTITGDARSRSLMVLIPGLGSCIVDFGTAPPRVLPYLEGGGIHPDNGACRHFIIGVGQHVQRLFDKEFGKGNNPQPNVGSRTEADGLSLTLELPE